MINFVQSGDDWIVTAKPARLAWQYDNQTRRIDIAGEFPSDYTTWQLLLQKGSNINVITLSATETGFGVELTASQLALSGNVQMQLLGINGTKKKHSNIWQMYIADSISGDAEWPTLPTAFSQAVAAAQAAQAAAETAAATMTVDTEMSDDSTHAVQNKVIKAYVDEHGGGGGFDIHSLTTEDSIADGDETPFYDVSAANKRKTTWSNVKAKLKAYFDTLYIGASALAGYATQAWVTAQGYLTQHQSLAAYRTSAAQDLIDNTKAEKLTVTFELTGQTSTCSSTIAEIYAAWQAGKIIDGYAGGDHYEMESIGLDPLYGNQIQVIFTHTANTYETANIGSSPTPSVHVFGSATVGVVGDIWGWTVHQLAPMPLVNAKQAKAVAYDILIEVSEWAGGTTVTVSAPSVTATNVVFCDSSDSSVQCTAQGAGTLTFTADATPTENVTVKVVILP